MPRLGPHTYDTPDNFYTGMFIISASPSLLPLSSASDTKAMKFFSSLQLLSCWFNFFNFLYSRYFCVLLQSCFSDIFVLLIDWFLETHFPVPDSRYLIIGKLFQHS